MKFNRGIDVKLNVKPMFITLHHEYVFEGPCRFGKGEQLEKEYDLMTNAELYKSFIKQVNAAMPANEVNVLEPTCVGRDESFLITEELIKEMAKDFDDVDFYIFNCAGRGYDLATEFIQRYRKPCVMMQNCCGNTSTSAAMISRGFEYYPYETWEDAAEHMKVLRVRKVLQQTKVLLATRLNSNISISTPDSFLSLEDITTKFGIRFRYADVHELLDQMQEIDPMSNHTTPGRAGLNPTKEDLEEIERLTDEFINNAQECDMERDKVRKSVKSYYIVKKFIGANDCNAFSMPCPDVCATRRLNEEQITPCLIHSLLNEDGISSACEYDIPALLSMIVLSNFANAPAYMGNTTPNPVDKAGVRRPLHKLLFNQNSAAKILPELGDNKNVYLTFHSVPNRKFKGFDKPMLPYAIRSFAYTGFGATIRYDFAKDKGQVITMMRFDPTGNKIFVAKGTVINGIGYTDQNCSEGVFFQVKDEKDFFQKQAAFGNHVPLVYGDYFDQVVELGKVMGLEVITA